MVWPAVVVGLVLAFKKEVRDLLTQVATLEAWGLKAGWDKREFLDVQLPTDSSDDDDEALSILTTVLQHSPHSFNHIRETTGLQLSDAEFEGLIRRYSQLFESVRIVKRGPKGERGVPGWPGIRLRRPLPSSQPEA